MEEFKDIESNKKICIGKKTKRIKKIFQIKRKENNKGAISKDSIFFENSTDLSSNSFIPLEEKSDTFSKVPSLDDIVIPSFFNDITKYDKVNQEINNYYKIKKSLNSQELADIYLIDIKRLYEEKKKI